MVFESFKTVCRLQWSRQTQGVLDVCAIQFSFCVCSFFARYDLRFSKSNPRGCLIVGFYNLFVLIPSLAVAVRRLHDLGKSGWMLLVSFIPLVGGIWLLILFLTEGNPSANKYGENPKAHAFE